MQYWLIYIILFIIGALIFYILKGVCGCKTVEGLKDEGWTIMKNNPVTDKKQIQCKNKDNEDNNECCWHKTIPSGQGRKCGKNINPTSNGCCCWQEKNSEIKQCVSQVDGFERWQCGCEFNN